MDTSCGETSVRVVEPGPANFSFRKLAVFLPIGLLLAGLVGGVAARAQEDFAPLILFPLLVGVVLGGLLVILMRVTNTGHRATVVIVTLLATVVAAAAEHYACYHLAVRAKTAAAASSKAASMAQAAFDDELGIPASFGEYLQREARRSRTILGFQCVQRYLWAVDGVLVGAAALAVVILAVRLPYCNQCRTWYRATRIGRLKPANGLLVGTAAGVSVPERLHSVRYRLMTCLGGCAPMGVELIWRDDDGQPNSVVVWLAPDARDRVVQILNHRASETDLASHP